MAFFVKWPLARPWARPKAGPVIRPEHACRGRPQRKSTFFTKNAILGLFWSFLSLLDLKNGSGSKFYARKWYRDVWKPQISQFHDKNVKLQNFVYTTSTLDHTPPPPFAPPPPLPCDPNHTSLKKMLTKTVNIWQFILTCPTSLQYGNPFLEHHTLALPNKPHWAK